ncbi:glycosyltransferase family 92 protein [Capillimicrobium parvum]|uniref:Glycosyl transferase family 2 n=1 Tax=Capillimicrobium parvum TaxID=2884022 RepID=A0A9E6XWG4_9ACTN|nr:glycosyltransferase family 92 protein [Capillimicrobium parvum]UGS35705.1 hypothetical protein DSM104329_02100 [Capillimicrobium parvum]
MPTEPHTTAAPRVAICAIAKDEGPYIAEWAAYHHLIGFDPIVVYDHESRDDTAAVLERLHAAGLAERIPWSVAPDVKPQLAAHADGIARLAGRAEWIAFIDLDELLVFERHDSVQAFVEQFGALGSIAMNWKMLGSAGHEQRTPGLVIERFDRCAERSYRGNRQVKSLSRLDLVTGSGLHTPQLRGGRGGQTLLGETLAPVAGDTREISHSIARVNHYFTRSRAEWDEKMARGKGGKSAIDPRKQRNAEEFAIHDRNEEAELQIGAFAPDVRALLDDIGLEA